MIEANTKNREVMKSIITVMATGLLIIASASVEAHPHGGHGKSYKYDQRQRVKQGVYSGRVTRGEVAMLRAQQKHINGLKRMARADGYVSPGERRMLKKAMRNKNRKIYQYKHNGRNRVYR